MTDDDANLIRILMTCAGMIMEDASARAILASVDDPDLVPSIRQAALDVITLADAADAVRRHAER